ncbi:transglutaminase family protein [Leekyejoonella antrihumi]|uniref:transglutaminase family protein n=1 Tax=Leekyejoonella antrihumi TaxID=1660198 RepID=UPI0016443EC2|nr:transglutaminase family protein [Leekyejoonella antrihumi]
MSATLRLVHTTGYTYNGPATASYNEARLAPLATADQTILHHRLEVSPSAWSQAWTDYWGTQVTSFEVHEEHDELQVVAISTVTVDRKTVAGDELTWDELAAPAVRDEFDELLEIGDRVDPGSDFLQVVRELRGTATTPAALVDAVVGRVHGSVSYVQGRTTVRSPARDAWATGEGTCQDMAHLVIGALRSQGIPARYVSGYVLPDRDAPLGESITSASHAWIQWWDGAWLGVDPASGRVPDDFYIEMARGRDYTDVVPLRGIFTGSPGSKMNAAVEISRLA